MSAKLEGVGGEILEIEFGRIHVSDADPDFVIWDFSGRVLMQRSFPEIDQPFASCLYGPPNLSGLQQLHAGEPDAKFVFEPLHLNLYISEQTLNSGPRHGLIASVELYSKMYATSEGDTWQELATRQILFHECSSMALLQFAFSIDRDGLHSFSESFENELREVGCW